MSQIIIVWILFFVLKKFRPAYSVAQTTYLVSTNRVGWALSFGLLPANHYPWLVSVSLLENLESPLGALFRGCVQIRGGPPHCRTQNQLDKPLNKARTRLRRTFMSLRQFYNYFDKVYKKRNPALMEGLRHITWAKWEKIKPKKSIIYLLAFTKQNINTTARYI